MAPQAGSCADVEAAFGVLAARYGLSNEAVGQLRQLQRLLVEDPLAPTAVRDPRKVIDDHLADSLVALELGVVRDALTVADLGSGAGVPGLPLAIALSSAEVALVESAGRKRAFLERAVVVCGVANVRVVHARAESWREGLGAYGLVTARALAPLEVVVEYAAPLLLLGGTLVAWRGRRDPAAERAAATAAAQIGLEPAGVLPVKPYPTSESRHLHLMSKVRETPPRFPRRPGMALKRPLGRS
ncbi:MAG: 16S rRNA (guanine(527)-N(7))-methyltransferase RsmG [Solirubrobacterales bacterium]|nr:16S rRNA (guanine(527)-N(7))-methyltransferase RsmG [Solirubrobacterales bacterium]MBV9942622.1 16S rRNA (guanine(527)-N(7))-methyltransferase RsmG [Solirubrobacterales bacterium]